MLAVGVDLVAIERIERLLKRYGDRFLERFCTAAELEERTASRAESAAARFAAKEAVVKALGVGLRPLNATGLTFHEIELLHDEVGHPYLRLGGRAAALAEAHGLHHWNISISHEAGLALAFVVALAPTQAMLQ